MHFTKYVSELPRISLTQEELKTEVSAQIAKHDGSFQFYNLVNTITKDLMIRRRAFKKDDNTSYGANLDAGDVARIREIIWDFIVLRYLTIGSYNQDEWPHLGITAKGKKFFEDSTL